MGRLKPYNSEVASSGVVPKKELNLIIKAKINKVKKNREQQKINHKRIMKAKRNN